MSKRSGETVENGDVVRRLVEHIRAEGLAVGDRLPSIRTLAARLNVGTNVVRYGMVQAQTMGLVKIHPRSGAFVQSLDFAPLVRALEETLITSLTPKDHNLFHLMETRRILELESVVHAATRRRPEDLLPLRDLLTVMTNGMTDRSAYVDADIRFHLGIARVANNPVLETVLHALLSLLRPCFVRVLLEGDRRARSEADHARIYAALLAGDAVEARAAMIDHLGLAHELLMREVASLPPGATATAQG
jgi:GntR family transcriptional repressor for pyruvate dehydrogenase complex